MSKLKDSDIVTDTLSTLKSLSKLCNDGILESNCQKMRTLLAKLLNNVNTTQFECFNYMSTNNLYPVDNAPTSKLTEVITKFTPPLD